MGNQQRRQQPSSIVCGSVDRALGKRSRMNATPTAQALADGLIDRLNASISANENERRRERNKTIPVASPQNREFSCGPLRHQSFASRHAKAS